ncbi:TssA family type VI secretion system protein [Nautilia lithotrophica]
MDELLKPINGGCGENVKYDDEYMSLEEEIEKLSSPTQAENVDFKKIKNLSESILKNKSKDFFAAVYYSYSSLVLEKDIKKSICFLGEFVDSFWEEGFPKREKAKVNAIKWWLSKIEKYLESISGFEDDVSDYINCVEKIENKLSSIDYAPAFTNLKFLLNQKIFKKEVQTEKPEEKTSEEKQTQENENCICLSEDINDNLKILSDKLNQLLIDVIENEIKCEYFIIRRMIVFYDIDSLPVATDKKTLIPPPAYEEKSSIQTLYKNGNYKDLINVCESKITTYVFWFDLHYYIAASLKSLGYENCAIGIKNSLRLFVNKFPTILEYMFSDGTPFATFETKQWLKEEVKKESVKDKYEIPNGNIKQKIEYITKNINTSEDIKNKINWILKFFEVYRGNDEIIDVYKNELFELLEQYQIAQIDKDLAQKAYLTLYELSDKDSEIGRSALKVLAKINPLQLI